MNKKTILRKQINEAKIRLAVAKESKKPSIPSTGVGILIESELDKASLLLSAEAITDRLTDMAEKVAKIEPDELMKMDAALKAQVGDEAASRFYSKTVEALRTLLDQIKAARDAVGVEIKGLKDGQIPNDMANQEPEALAPEDGTVDPAAEMGADMAPAPEGGEGDEDLAADIDPEAYADDADPVVDPEPALGRDRKDSPLKESRDPDAIVLESFIAQMRKSGNALTSARIVAEQFDIDVSDVKDIVKEAALSEKKKLPKGFVPFKKGGKKEDVKEADDILAEKKKLPKGFVPFKKGGKKEEVKEADDADADAEDGDDKKKGKGFVPFKKGGKKSVAESADFQPMSYDGWIKAVDKAMKERYGIDLTNDAGVDEEDCRRHYQGAQESKESIDEFVIWWGEKYDIDPIGSGW